MKKTFRFLISIIIWELVAFLVDNSVFPYLHDILMYIWDKGIEGYGIHVVYSLCRMLLGLSLTLLVSLCLGLLGFYHSSIRKFVDRVTYMSYPIPKMALLPIVLMIFGLSEMTKIFMIFLISFFPVMINIRDAIDLIPKDILDLFESLGASPKDLIKKVIIPSCLPAVFTSLRISVGIALSVLFFTENFGTSYGLGYMIMNAWMRIDYIAMYVGIILISTMGVVIYLLLDQLNKKFCPWLFRR